MKVPRRKRRTIQDDKRFEDQGFEESNQLDEYLYNRSQRINPTELPYSPRYEITVPGILARRMYPMRGTRGS